jgi:hypothetical protein
LIYKAPQSQDPQLSTSTKTLFPNTVTFWRARCMWIWRGLTILPSTLTKARGSTSDGWMVEWMSESMNTHLLHLWLHQYTLAGDWVVETERYFGNKILTFNFSFW